MGCPVRPAVCCCEQASVGSFKEAEETLLLVQNEKYQSDPCYLSWLARCYVMNGKARQAWELYLKMDTSTDSFNLLQVRGAGCGVRGAGCGVPSRLRAGAVEAAGPRACACRWPASPHHALPPRHVALPLLEHAARVLRCPGCVALAVPTREVACCCVDPCVVF
jgi:hypothetical protein